ncbi:hypothetical protein J4477_00395 [Candidatus Pacearchaeota archaeon]|nr:hypothetical protein [Candidatus Pacearchaeota archaeon]
MDLEAKVKKVRQRFENYNLLNYFEEPEIYSLLERNNRVLNKIWGKVLKYHPIYDEKIFKIPEFYGLSHEGREFVVKYKSDRETHEKNMVDIVNRLIAEKSIESLKGSLKEALRGNKQWDHMEGTIDELYNEGKLTSIKRPGIDVRSKLDVLKGIIVAKRYLGLFDDFKIILVNCTLGDELNRIGRFYEEELFRGNDSRYY